MRQFWNFIFLLFAWTKFIIVRNISPNHTHVRQLSDFILNLKICQGLYGHSDNKELLTDLMFY